MIITKVQALAIALGLAMVGVAAAARGEGLDLAQRGRSFVGDGMSYSAAVSQDPPRNIQRL